MPKMTTAAFLFVGTATFACAGCSFKLGSGSSPPPATPPAASPAPPATPAAPPAASTVAPGVRTLGRKPVLVAPAATPATPPPAAAGIPVLVGTNVFGSGTPDAAGWKGSFFPLSAGTTKLPPLATLEPKGVLFARELNVAPKPMVGGFPGIDPARNENFALRWEAPLVVDNEADYTFRIVSDNGSIVTIDGTLIVDNDGAHGVAEKSGPVHLVKGTHVIAVDYFQTVGAVALQLFCKKAGGTETICPTRL